MTNHVQLIGHRGSRATHPENSISGFLHTMSCGADGLELDVCITRDDRLVVTHDLVLSERAQIVREHTAAELSLPELSEILALPAPPGFWIDIEAKSAPGLTPEPEHYAALLSAAIRSAQERILVRSFEHDLLRAFHALEPAIPLAALIEHDSEEWVGIAKSANAVIISPLHSTITEARVVRAHAADIRVSAWTVNEPEDWTRLAAMGVDSIITDDPARAVKFFRQ